MEEPEVMHLGKTSGKANIKKNLEDLGIELDPESLKKVTNRIIELSDIKETVTTEDFPYIVSDVLDSDIVESECESNKLYGYSYNGLTPGCQCWPLK